jgi:hypothetical protein
MRHFRVQFKRFLGNPTPGSPFCARSKTTVKFQTESGPGVPILVKAHAPPTPSAFEKLPHPPPPLLRNFRGLNFVPRLFTLGKEIIMALRQLRYFSPSRTMGNREDRDGKSVTLALYPIRFQSLSFEFSMVGFLCGLYSVTQRLC